MMKHFRAITLIETILYLALFGLIFTSIFQFVFNIQDGNQQALTLEILEKNRIFLSQHFKDSFTNSLQIDTNQSTFNDDNGVIRLNNGPEYKIYALDNGRLQYSESGTVNYVTPSDTNILSFYLTPLQHVDGTVVAVDINLVIETVGEVSDSVTLNSVYSIE
jgi:type II secretory pathway pseudopilin PulG